MLLDDVEALRKHSPAWKLLRADNAPLILSFLCRVFVDDNVRSISSAELISQLDDELYALNDRLSESAFPKPAKAYLEPDLGHLNQYSGPGLRWPATMLSVSAPPRH